MKLRRLAWILALVAFGAAGAAIFGFWQAKLARAAEKKVGEVARQASEAASKANVSLAHFSLGLAMTLKRWHTWDRHCA